MTGTGRPDDHTGSSHPDDDVPAISVVVPVLNEARDIARLLGEILRQIPPDGGFEVLVADGGSTDGTRSIVAEMAAADARLRLLHNPNRLSSAGRNVGVKHARGTYVVFIDGHCELPRDDYLVRMAEIFSSTGADCLSRPQPMLALADGTWGDAIAKARHSWFGHNPGSDIYGGEPGVTDARHAGAAYTRACLVELGGYDERFDACEDVEFNHRVAASGLRAYRHPDLTLNYRPRSNLHGLIRQVFRYGRGRARLMTRHPGVVPWPLVIASVGAVLGPPVLLAISGTRALPWIAGALLSWLIVATTESVRVASPGTQAVRVLLSFAAIQIGMTLGFCRGLLEFRRFRGATMAPQLEQADLAR